MTAARSSVAIAAATCADAAGEPVVAARQVGLVRARAVVVGAARVDREAERHRLQRARLVARQLEALDVRGERRRALADDLGGRPRALGQQRAEALPGADLLDRPQQRAGVAEAQPRRVDQAALDALHRPGDRAARRDRVEAQLVAAAARLEHGVRVRDAAHRPEREDVLVLDAHLLAAAPSCRCARSRSRTRRSCCARRRARRRGPRPRAAGPRRTSPPGSCGWAAWRSR